jgi:hypothetical protein
VVEEINKCRQGEIGDFAYAPNRMPGSIKVFAAGGAVSKQGPIE